MTARSYRVRGATLRLGALPDWASPTLADLSQGQIVARLDERIWNERFFWVFADIAGDGAFEGYADAEALESLALPAQPAPALDGALAAPYPGGVLRIGERDAPKINAAQARLADLLDDLILTPSVYDANMAAAVAEFQAAALDAANRPLRVDGAIGAETWRALFNSSAPSLKAPTSAMRVKRRANTGLFPLAHDELNACFGAFTFEEGPRDGEITLDPAWARANIVSIEMPGLTRPGRKLDLHRKAVGPLRRAMARIAKANLTHLVRVCNGTWVPRHKSWNPHNGISPHSWGVALDINERWNPVNGPPAAPGTEGSVHELVPHFEAEGFAWGGHFTDPVDGMHFELARADFQDRAVIG